MSANFSPAIDRALLAELTDGDFEFEIELITTFTEAGLPLLGELNLGLTSQNRAQVRHCAHTLKGSALAIGAQPFAELCANIEAAARSDSEPLDAAWPGELAVLFNQIESQLHQMQRGLAA